MTTYRQGRILVIDDDVKSAGSIRVFLSFLGYEPVIADCGYCGLQQARTAAPDAVLCALGLPGISAFELADELREDPCTAGARLIALVDFREHAFAGLHAPSRFERYLFRPPTLAALREALDGIQPCSGARHCA